MNKRVQSYKITRFNSCKMHLTHIYCAIITGILFFYTNLAFAQNKASDSQVIKTVCIDAGHGGKDPGCHGASSNEKTVCLSIALKLGAKIKEVYPEINVIYTRDKDVFVELDERANFANKNKADLFICIHANSASPTAKGTETFVLGLHKTDAQQKIMERENSSIYLEEDKGEKYKSYDMTPDAIIQKQMMLATFLDQSISFASKLQSEFKKMGRYDRGVKQAGFIVLYKTTMPSVLIETGFLTNAEDEKFLKSSASQDEMANSMFIAFQKHKNELEGTNIKTQPKENKEEVILVEKEKEPVKENKEVTFMIQIETSDSKVPLTSSRFKGLEVFEYKQDNFYKYAVGNFINDFAAANSYKNELREKGYQHAFVIAFQNGERIALDQALKIVKK